MRFGVLAAFAVAALASLSLLRFYRPPGPDEIDRRIEAANALPAHAAAGADRQAGRQAETAFRRRCGANTRNAWPRSWTASAATCRAPACRSVTRWPCARSRRCWSSPPSPSPSVRAAARWRMPFAPWRFAETVPPRIDAWVTPPAYTGKAPIFLTAESNEKTPVFTVPAGSDVILRVTGGTGDESRFPSPIPPVRRVRSSSRSGSGGADAPDAQPVAVAGDGLGAPAVHRKADRRRRSRAAGQRAGDRPLGVRRDTRQAAGYPLFRRAEARGQRRLRTPLRNRGRLRRGIRRGRLRAGDRCRRPTRVRFTARRRCRCRVPRRGGKRHRHEGDARPDRTRLGRQPGQAHFVGRGRCRAGGEDRDQDPGAAGASVHQSARQGSRRAAQDFLARRQQEAACRST